MASKKTWTEKLAQKKEPKVKYIDFDFAGIPANSNMLVATPQIFDEYIKQIPEGKFVNVNTVRNDLALDNNADYTCPVTTGIFLRIVAEAAYEKYTATGSLKYVTPFWRVIAPGSELAKKLSCGEEFLATVRKKEGLE